MPEHPIIITPHTHYILAALDASLDIEVLGLVSPAFAKPLFTTSRLQALGTLRRIGNYFISGNKYRDIITYIATYCV